MEEYNIAFASMLNRWKDFFEWFETKSGISFESLDDGERMHCPIHGGDSGEAFRLYDDFNEIGGAICNSCIHLRARNGIELLTGLIIYTENIPEQQAKENALGLIKQYLTEKRIPEHSPNSARQLHRYHGFNASDVAVSYLRGRGLPLWELPHGLKGATRFFKKGPDNETLILNALAGLLFSKDGVPLTFHYVLLDDNYEKIKIDGVETKGSAYINKEKSLSGAYVDLTWDANREATTLIYGEGMETVLAAAFAHQDPALARAKVGGGASYKNHLIPENINRVIYALDNDHTLNEALNELGMIAARYRDKEIYAAIPPQLSEAEKIDWLDRLKNFPESLHEDWKNSLKKISPSSGVPMAATPNPTVQRFNPLDALSSISDVEDEPVGERTIVTAQNIPGIEFTDGANRPLVDLNDIPDVHLFDLLDRLVEQKTPEYWYVYALSKEIVHLNANTEITNVKDEDVGLWISQYIEFGKITSNRNGVRVTYAGTPTSRVKTWWKAEQTKKKFLNHLKTLKAVVNKPILIRDSESDRVKLLSGEGYDPEYQYFFDVDPLYKEASDDADRMLDTLKKNYAGENESLTMSAYQRKNISMLWKNYFTDEIFYDFEFASPADEANIYAALFAPLLAGMAPATPFIMIEAPQRGSGKTFLAKAVTSIWGRTPNLGLDENSEELQKTLVSAFAEGHNQLLIDNISGYIKSDILARLLTDPRNTTFRILGGNKTIKPPENMVLVGTANNAQIQEEIMRRTLIIRLEPKALDPAQRTRGDFKHPNLLDVINRNKKELASIIYLTIKSWLDCGAPEFTHQESFTGFEEWSNFSHVFLWWAGTPNASSFIKNRKALLNQGDQEINDIETFLELWVRQYGYDNPQLAQELVTAAHNEELPFGSVFQKNNVNEQSKQMGRELNPLLGRRFLLTDGTVVAIQKKKAHRFPEKNNMPYVAYQLKRLADGEPAPSPII